MAADQRQDEPADFVQSVGRALRILEVVSAGPAMTVKVIARRCELNLSTAYHLVRTLAYEGYLTRLSDGTYVCGEAVAGLFYERLGALGRPPSACEVLRRLEERTGLSAYLGRISAEQVTVVEFVEGPGSPYLEDFERGLNVSAHATALGKALMLGLSRRDRRSFLRNQGLQPFTAETVTDLDSLDAELSRLVSDQAVVEHGQFRSGVACAARLIGGATPSEPAWAIAVSCRDDDIPGTVYRELALAAADMRATEDMRATAGMRGSG
jgi:DNA-binding IclR family transcriptional regulator